MTCLICEKLISPEELKELKEQYHHLIQMHENKLLQTNFQCAGDGIIY